MQARLYAAAFDAMVSGGVGGAFPLTSLALALVQPSYRFDRTHTSAAALRDHELGVEDYGRQVLQGVRLERDSASNDVLLIADDVDFGALGPGERVAGAIVLQGTGDEAALRAYFELPKLGAHYPGTTGGPVLIAWPNGQLLRLREPQG